MNNNKTYKKTFDAMIDASATLLAADTFGELSLSKYEKIKLKRFCAHLIQQIEAAPETHTILVRPKRVRQ